MAGRGRRVGYNNYTVQDQILLCTLVDDIVPIGRNMWEQVVIRFNATRSRGSPERDLDSLCRKFKKLHAMKKPTGKGEVPGRLQPVLLAKAAQMKIESKGGVHTTHDGLDHGDDDDELLLDEQEASQEGIGGRGLVTQTGLVVREAVREGRRAGDDLDDQDTDDHDHLAEREDDDREEPEYRDFDGTRPGDDFSQGAQQPAPSSPHERVAGTIMTEGGPIDVSMAADYPLSSDDASNAASSEGENTGGTVSSNSQTVREPELQIDTQRRVAGTRLLQPDAASPLPDTTPPTTTSAAARSSGRPRTSRKKPLPTSATPDGPHLQHNPQRADEDAREALNRRLSVRSNRLGGQDLRAFRDNFEHMTQGMLNAGGKRTPTDKNNQAAASSTPSFSKNKRIKAKQRLDEIQKEIDEAERRHSSSRGDIMGMLLLFQKDSDRRAEKEERRRRDERDERLESEKREREEREHARIAEAQAARELREEQRRIDQAKEAQKELDREESKRRFEERLALDREEAQLRHEQMMMVLAGLTKQKQ